MKLEPDSTIPRCPNCYKALDLAHLHPDYGDGEEEHELCWECREENYGRYMDMRLEEFNRDLGRDEDPGLLLPEDGK